MSGKFVSPKKGGNHGITLPKTNLNNECSYHTNEISASTLPNVRLEITMSFQQCSVGVVCYKIRYNMALQPGGFLSGPFCSRTCHLTRKILIDFFSKLSNYNLSP